MSELKAKRHSVLENLRLDLSRGYLEKEVTVRGFKFKLHTLNEDEESWADAYVRIGTPIVMLNSRKAPRVAASILAVNDVPVEELFQYPEDMPKSRKDELDNNAIRKKYWLRDQMVYFLAEEGIRPFINELYASYEELESQRDAGIAELPKS